MGYYVVSPFKPPVQLLVPGTPSYVFGGYNDRTSPTFGYIISDSAVTTTGTVTFRIIDGNEPAVGEKITVRGAANSANFNVTNGTILTESTTPDGICTVTYAISSTTQGTTSDGGQVLIPRNETFEVATAAGSTVPVAGRFSTGAPNQGEVLTVSVSAGGTQASNNVQFFLQGSNFDRDDEYTDIATVAGFGTGPNTTQNWISGEATGDGTGSNVPGAVNMLAYRFYRVRMSGTFPGSDQFVIKIST